MVTVQSNCQVWDSVGFRKKPNISLPNVFSNAGFKAISSKVIPQFMWEN